DNEPNPAKIASESPPADVVPYAGLSPQDACDKASLPPGFKMHLFAGEPDIKQPIAFCLDDRGRVWVAEGYTYPRRHGDPPPLDRGLSGRSDSASSNAPKKGPAASADALRQIGRASCRERVVDAVGGVAVGVKR